MSSRAGRSCGKSAASIRAITTMAFRPGWCAATGTPRMSNWAERLATVILVVAMAGATVGVSDAAENPRGRAAATKPSQKMGLGREALPAEIAAWDSDVRPDGRGLPAGRGTVKQGDQLFAERCASCHGEFGQGIGRLSALAGGHGTLKADRPDKTIGSFWPNLSTVYDYVK